MFGNSVQARNPADRRYFIGGSDARTIMGSENDHGSMNLASNTAPVASTMPSRVAAIQRTTGCCTRR